MRLSIENASNETKIKLKLRLRQLLFADGTLVQARQIQDILLGYQVFTRPRGEDRRHGDAAFNKSIEDLGSAFPDLVIAEKH